jgi:hypothetical protein
MSGGTITSVVKAMSRARRSNSGSSALTSLKVKTERAVKADFDFAE